MGFLDDAPDLSGWRYNQRDLQLAREYLVSALESCLPTWLSAPRGTLAGHWLASGPYPTCFIIRVAQIFYTLERSVTRRSVPVLREKLVLLFDASGAQFEELLGELEIAASLVERISPISLEPLVSERTSVGHKPSSPDFAIRLPEGDVCIEATTLRIGILNRWDREGEQLSEEISRYAKKRRLSTEIELQLPVGFLKSDLVKNGITEILDLVAKSPTGEAPLPVSRGQGSFSWRPISVFALDANALIHAVDSVIPDAVTHAIVVARHLLVASDPSDLVLKSLRNTLDSKRDQRPPSGPYVIAMKLGHHRLLADGVRALLTQRIWPNKQYGGIAAIMHFTSPSGFGATEPAHSLWLLPNPNARSPVPQSVIEAFEGTAQFHMP
jgi:hypothetical protein